MQMTVFDCRHGEETKRNPREDGKGKWEEMANHQLKEERTDGC